MAHLSRRRMLGGLGSTLAAACGGVWPLAAHASSRRRQAGSAGYVNVQRLLDRYVAEHKVAGAVGAIKSGSAPVAFLNAGALSFDGPPCDANSLYRLYSMSKPITAIAAWQLIERGRLTLDEPIAQIVPEFRSVRVLDRPDALESHPTTVPITVRHLMTHTSGLTYHVNGDLPIHRAYRRAGILPIGRYRIADVSNPQLGSLTVRAGDLGMPATLDAFAVAVAALPLVSEPGTVWTYGIGLDVLGLVIQRAAGLPFESVLRENLFRPLGMNDTGFFVPPDKVQRLSTSYSVDPMGATFIFDDRTASAFTSQTGAPCGGAGLVSSTSDFARFCEMLLNGGTLGGVRILSVETVRMALSDLLPPSVRRDFGFGAGAEIGRFGEFGWTGGASMFWVDVKRRTYVVFMTQLVRHEYPIVHDIHEAVDADLSGAAVSR